MPDNVDRPILGLPDLLATAEGLQQALEMNYYIDDCKIPPGFPLDDPGFLFHHARMCAAAIKYAVIPNGLAYPNARESMRWLKNILRIILLEIGFDASELITQRKIRTAISALASESQARIIRVAETSNRAPPPRNSAK